MELFNSVETFIENLKKCTFGLYVITSTKPTFKSKYNSFRNNEVTKITFYKNAICGASYKSILQQVMKQQIKENQNALIANYNANVNQIFNSNFDFSDILNEAFTKINKVIFKESKKKIDENFTESLPWGSWLKYPLLIEHTNAKFEKNQYLRIYNNNLKTSVKTFYFIDGVLIEPESEIYKQLISELREKTISPKQSENGFTKTVIPCAYNTKNIVYLQQGQKTFINCNYITMKQIKEIFKNM